MHINNDRRSPTLVKDASGQKALLVVLRLAKSERQ